MASFFITHVALFLQRSVVPSKLTNLFTALYVCTYFMYDYHHGHHILYMFALRMVIIPLYRQRTNEYTHLLEGEKGLLSLCSKYF